MNASPAIEGLHFLLNGEPQVWNSGMSVAGLLEAMGLLGQRLAVERNGTIVPKSAYAETWLDPGDRLEVVRAVGGG